MQTALRIILSGVYDGRRRMMEEEEEEIKCDCYGCVTMRHACIHEETELLERLQDLGFGDRSDG